MASAVSHFNMGNGFRLQGKLDEAIACYRHALIFKPDFVPALNNLGGVLKEQGKLDEASACFQQALRVQPNLAEAWDNLGNTFQLEARLDDAVRCFLQALRIQPHNPEFCNNLASALTMQDKVEEAAMWYRQALRLKPDHLAANHHLGNLLAREEKLDEALQCYRQALRLKPDLAEAHNNLGNILLRLGQVDQARAHFEQALAVQPHMATAQSNRLFCMNYDPQAEETAVLAEHLRWGRSQESATPPAPHANDPDPERPLRIGYVSPDFCRHALCRYFEPVLAHHDRRRMHVFCYAEVARPDAMTSRLQSLAHAWRWTCRLSDAQLVQCIRDDKIDILVDLAVATRLEKNIGQLAELRRGLRDCVASTLCAGAQFTQGLEEAYHTMWRRWCDRRLRQ